MDKRVNSGKTTAEKMTAEERKARAMKGVEARKERATLPKVSHKGELRLGEISIPCYVLNDGKRVLSSAGLRDSLKLIDGVSESASGTRLKRLFTNKGLSPYISSKLVSGHFEPIICIDGGKKINGYEAHVLSDICDSILEARRNGAINTSRMKVVAEQCEILMRGFARVGIIALVDEATGYQDAREKNALAEILEAFVAKELQPWLKTFPDEYYRLIFKLYNLPYPPKKNNFRPGFIGRLTNEVVYERLAPELLPELKKEANKLNKKARLHQFLTGDVGHPKLREHLASLVTLMKLSSSPEDFRQKVDMIHPKFGNTYEMNFDGE